MNQSRAHLRQSEGRKRRSQAPRPCLSEVNRPRRTMPGVDAIAPTRGGSTSWSARTWSGPARPPCSRRLPALHGDAARGLTTLTSRTGRSVLDYDRDSRSQPECRLGDRTRPRQACDLGGAGIRLAAAMITASRGGLCQVRPRQLRGSQAPSRRAWVATGRATRGSFVGRGNQPLPAASLAGTASVSQPRRAQTAKRPTRSHGPCSAAVGSTPLQPPQTRR